MKNNKEIINELETYFLDQDPKVVARTLAALLIDLNRITTFSNLPIQEQESLKKRLELNAQQFRDFLTGKREKLIYKTMNSSED